MEFMLWIVSTFVVLLTWEANNMGMQWHGFTPLSEWTKWGPEDEADRGFAKWGFRIGPLEIFKM